MKIKKYINFLLFEKVDEYISHIMLDIHKTIKNFSELNYYLDLREKYGISFYINIEKNEKKTLPIYHANVSIKEMLKKEFVDFVIEFYIEDDKIDNNKIFEILSHEISHVYQLINGDDKYFESFNKMKNIEEFKNTVVEYKGDFLNYIYYNFLHELDARVNQVYEGYLYSKLETLEEMINQFNKGKLFNILMFIGNFNHNNLLNIYNHDELVELTNQFNILYGMEKIKKEELTKYYYSWENVFKENSIKYIKLSEEAIEQAYNKQKRYVEKKLYSYDETILNEKIEYNCDQEILKLVEEFKKIYNKK